MRVVSPLREIERRQVDEGGKTEREQRPKLKKQCKHKRGLCILSCFAIRSVIYMIKPMAGAIVK